MQQLCEVRGTVHTKGNTCAWERGRPAPVASTKAGWKLSVIAVLTKIGLVGQGCTRYRKQTPCAPSLRVLRVSVCIRLAHAEARRRGDRERSGNGRLARHGRSGRGSTYLRTAISVWHPRREVDGITRQSHHSSRRRLRQPVRTRARLHGGDSS